MGNFDFVATTLPMVHEDCKKAESFLSSDPVTASFYSRRAVDVLVKHLFELFGLSVNRYRSMGARINAGPFKARTGRTITLKLNMIREIGNKAAHDSGPIRQREALQVVRDLHHVLVWAAIHHSPHPDAAPTHAVFDPALAAKSAPLTRAEVAQLFTRFQEQDAAYAKKLAEHEELARQKDAEIVALRAEIAAAQAARTIVDDRDYSEEQTRDLFIDVLLREAGWALDDDRDREFPVTGMPGGKNGRVDYVLWGADGLPLAVVEAKKTSRSAFDGQEQARCYADCLEKRFGRRPAIFFTNGYEHQLWDDAAGYPPREVAGFLTRDELELMIARRETRTPLAGAPINVKVVERPYQKRAIAAVGAAFDEKQREALLVMATGAGKTRTVIALVEQLMKAGWVRRVLFLADRIALVNQAVGAFKTHLPSVPTVNLMTERYTTGRVYVSTYPTMMNLIDEIRPDGERRFGPGHFDLVVIDEAHRSVYQKYGAIFAWFDSLLVGLTATPKGEVDRNTYRLFHLEDGVPTDNYPLAEAIEDGFLVPPRGVAVGTKFLRQGIRYDDLSEAEKIEWDAADWGDGDPPTEVGVEELNRFLFNEDTVDKVLGHLMTEGHRVAGGDRLGKTIIFAKSQAHADFIQKRFDAQYPHLAGSFARTITHGNPLAQKLIDDFGDPGRAPHIAISVDMLDTGIDVPSVVNLVFFKTVHAKSKFWQMIGRGTRLCPDLFGPGLHKQDFRVFDFCGNLEYFQQDLPDADGSAAKSLGQRLFEARVQLVRGLDVAGTDAGLRSRTAATLHELVAGMNVDNFLVRPQRKWVERFSEASAWSSLTAQDAEDVAAHLARLPSTVTDDDTEAKGFDLLILRRQLAQLDGAAGTAERVRNAVMGIASGLLTRMTVPSVAEHRVLIEAVAGDEWWAGVTLPMLEEVRVRLRGLVWLVEVERRKPVYTDFADELGDARDVDLPDVTPGVNRELFEKRVRACLREHADHVSLQRLRRNRPLTADDLAALEQMLGSCGVDVTESAVAAGGLGLFIRSLVGLDRAAVQEAFAKFLDEGRYHVDQIRFVGMIVSELTSEGTMDPNRLYEAPYDDHSDGPHALFPDPEVDELFAIIRTFTHHAHPAGAA